MMSDSSPTLNAQMVETFVGLPERATYLAVQLVFFGGLMHGCFHAWRHTALYDGALRNITPRFAHRIL